MNNNTGQQTRTNGRSSTTWIVLVLVVISGGWFIARQSPGRSTNAAAASGAPPPPVPLRPGDDPAYDWERPGRPQATNSGDWTYAIKPRFASSRTLQQTTNWLMWALVSYGRVQEPAESSQISDVKFQGCSMQWDEKRFIDEGNQINDDIPRRAAWALVHAATLCGSKSSR
jgi:hypothetical protein